MTHKYIVWDNQTKSWFKPYYNKTESDFKTEEILFSSNGDIWLRKVSFDGKEILKHFYFTESHENAGRFIPFNYTGFRCSDETQKRIYEGHIVKFIQQTINELEQEVIYYKGQWYIKPLNDSESFTLLYLIAHLLQIVEHKKDRQKNII